MNKQEIEKAIELLKRSTLLDAVYTTEDHDKTLQMAISALTQLLNNGWIPVSKRLPTRDEYLKDDGRFIVTDGMRRYQGIFNNYDNRFDRETHDGTLLREDKCVTAWQPLPEAYKEVSE
jgi:hypothetical protein